ncbi:MAG: hypothetical protein ACFFG0_12375 [Candidatus Thorarchaeota archaeon]
MDEKSMKRTFLLGAGFTYDISHNQFPLLNEINKKVQFDKELETKYNFRHDDIEIFFTRMDIDLAHNKNPELKKKRDDILEQLVDLFSMKGKKILSDKTGDFFINNILRKDDIILTTNYDSYLENLLGHGKWSPHGGYGERMTYEPGRDDNRKLLNIKIFKLHGSPAFIVVKTDEKDDTGDIELQINKTEFPEFRSSLGFLKEYVKGHYLILPSFIKPIEFNAISSLYQESIEAIRDSNILVIIGSSLRREDYMLWFILSYLDRKDTKIIIVDPNPEPIRDNLIDILRFSPKIFTLLSGCLKDNLEELRKLL